MFRPMRRFKQQLSRAECVSLLREAKRGVLSLRGDDDYPYAVPMNFVYDEETNALYFHCAKQGHKLDAIARHDKASFCVIDEGTPREGHWSLDFRSVIVFGRIGVVEDAQETVRRVRQLGVKYYPDPADADREIAQTAGRVLCLRLAAEHISGKCVNES